MKVLLSGNEAIARGAFEAGVAVAAAYPGTPSTEILENIVKYDEIYAEWSVNEKVAFEVAWGAAVAGQRSLAAMKHVGVNVASDALMTAAYTGSNAGFVFISADDPGMHSSQNEQDNRIFAKFAQIPALEPSNSQEAKEFTKLAFDISEKFDTPVMIRMTTRICHGKTMVSIEKRDEREPEKYEKDTQKFVMIPAHARKRHVTVKERTKQLENFANTFSENRIEMNDTKMGIITSGISYMYAKEVFPKASYFKLGMVNPIPMQKIKEFAAKVDKLYVVEELEPFFEDQLKAEGIEVIGKNILPDIGEYSPDILRSAILGPDAKSEETTEIPLVGRPPVMCSGCPHRAVFSVLKKQRTIISGDIGCYTLSSLPPLNTMDTCICMGGSVGVAQGLVRTMQGKKKDRIVSVLGDSTFIHSGIPSLVNAVYNQANITIVILDNRITAMTGHQENPGTGKTLEGKDVPEFDFEGMAKASGVKYVRVIDPIDVAKTNEIIAEAIEQQGPSVVIAKRACVLVERHQFPSKMQIIKDKCTACKLCLNVGCPAISIDSDGKMTIDTSQCFGCTLCKQTCKHDAIVPYEA